MSEAESSLPEPLQRAWRSLSKADELVQGFGERGWIADETRAVVEVRTAAIARRTGRVQSGSASDDDATLRRDMDELTSLLVALADAAVAAQPSLAPETPVPVTMADAQARLADTTDLLDDAGA